jgi:carboxyl-terminal processing protease
MLFAFGGQDMYSTYYTYEEFEELIASSQGEAKGIGVYITGTNTAMTVTYVMKDSPAQKAGILAGDEIVEVDGQKVADIGYNEATNLVIGENGTAVVLTVNRNGQNIDISVIRGDYTPETVLYNCITEGDKKIGYIKIIQFDQITVTQFKTAVEELKKQGCDKFVFDVRSNPGGELTAIVDILDYLLPKGPIVHILDRDMNVEHTYNSDASELKAEMVVLTNGGTASAAELFTSALRDYEKATLVGMKTYGKGCGQDHYFLSNGGVISITSFFYNPPYGENYNGEGIYPNIEVELPEEYENIWMIPFEKDTQLQAAIEKLTK